MNMSLLEKEHCWRIISDISIKLVFTEKDLIKEVKKIKLLNTPFTITKLW